MHLTPKAFDLLSLLIAEAPRVVPKEHLHREIWPSSFVSDASLLGLVKEVRHALGDERTGALIRTAHRVGYAFAAPLERVDLPNVSRRHARIVLIGHEATIEDLGSTNGTVLRDQNVAQPAALRHGDRIRVGDACLTFHVASTTAPNVTLPMRAPDS